MKVMLGDVLTKFCPVKQQEYLVWNVYMLFT